MNWLFPERRGPSKYSILDHSLVTTPRAPWFGLLGLLSILGLIVLVFFKDKHKDA
jgi:hypothetical protein